MRMGRSDEAGRISGGRWRGAGLLGLLLLMAVPALAGLPPEGLCPQLQTPPGAPPSPDASGPRLKEGSLIGLGDMPALASLLPEEIWAHRNTFFYEGMQMQIGHCHRRYPVAGFFKRATQKFAGHARVDSDGNLHGYVAGLPFPPEEIDPKGPQAGVKWAWDMAFRYQGAGPVGRFRLLDLPGRMGKAVTYTGRFFLLRTGHRADLVASHYQLPESKDTEFVAGGRFEEPFDARGLAWRQMRPEEAQRDYKDPDDTFVYVPEMRKVRRAAATWVDGLYVPRYRTATLGGGGGVPYNQGGSPGVAPSFSSIAPTAGLAIQATENIRRGFTGLEIRPNAYRWKVLGEREVLAPLNTTVLGWPIYPDRNYGPSGLSLATDTWDVREAIVIQGVARRIVDDLAAITLWVDEQTQEPLYYISYRKNGLLMDIGILGYQWSGDRGGYPAWPGGEPANVFDPVVESFYYVPGGGSGWRRESYDVKSVPLDPGEVRRLTTTDLLLQGH